MFFYLAKIVVPSGTIILEKFTVREAVAKMEWKTLIATMDVDA